MGSKQSISQRSWLRCTVPTDHWTKGWFTHRCKSLDYYLMKWFAAECVGWLCWNNVFRGVFEQLWKPLSVVLHAIHEARLQCAKTEMRVWISPEGWLVTYRLQKPNQTKKHNAPIFTGCEKHGPQISLFAMSSLLCPNCWLLQGSTNNLMIILQGIVLYWRAVFIITIKVY